ncbi:hypothetical protein FT670_05185 [Aeromonas jandaei]|nr:hypothetical protein FT670_05185 [Aeromonas jandaei]
MLNMPLSEFIEKCNDLSDKMRVEYRNGAPLFVFSNTSSGESEKSFAITHTQLISVFENIIDNQNEFSSHEEYDQNPWRTLLSEHIEDDVARALATVQTLPFFELLNKVIVISNGIEHTYKYKKMSLKLEHLQAAKSYLIQESSITYPIQKTNTTIPSIKKSMQGAISFFMVLLAQGKVMRLIKR